MVFKTIHKTLSFKRLLFLLIGFTTLVQLIVITYNHFSGYAVLQNFQHFVFRFLIGIVLSVAIGFLIAYPDLFLINYLNKVFQWSKSLWRRLIIEFTVAIVIAVLTSVCFTMAGNLINSYPDLSNVFIYNALIFSVVNIIMVSTLEGWMFSIESNHARQVAENLRKELSEIKFEVLKSQINPHFLFNSLNVLSELMSQNTVKAQQFIDEFSYVYRHVIETIEQPYTTLSKELEFARSYLFLQQMRYGESLTYSIDIKAEALHCFLPPLSLQMLLENVFKHNIVNEAKPLHISIWNENEQLVVRNPIQPRISIGKSTGLGLKNLKKRYSLIHIQQPSFKMENDFYLAKLPLIKPEEDESSDY